MVSADETIVGCLVAGGANVEVLGRVKGPVRACGANVAIPGEIDGVLRAFGAHVVLSGTFHNAVKAAAANLVLSGTFDGDVEVAGARVTVAPTAVVKGDLIYSAAELNLQEGAQIKGIVHRDWKRGEVFEKWRKKGILAVIPVGAFFWFISVVSLVIVGAIVNYLYPKRTDEVVATIPKSVWKNIWFGLIFVVVVPVAIFIAMLTVVGIPAGLIAALIYGIALYISRIYIGVWIGRMVHAPEVEIGLQAVSDEELDAIRKQRRRKNE